MSAECNSEWLTVCKPSDLVPEAGIAVWTKAGPVAIFHLPDSPEQVFAISHYDPLGGANVLARGIVGDIQGEPVVASPLYKQHFSLRSGQCIENEGVTVPAFRVRINGDRVELQLSQGAVDRVAA